MKNTPENIASLKAQLKTCPRCGRPEVLDPDPATYKGDIELVIATCTHHGYARILVMASPAANAAMG